MHWEKSPSSEQPGAKPYQGVRVKDPVKELLRRKRGTELNNAKVFPNTPVFIPNSLSSCPQIGPSDSSDMGVGLSEGSAVQDAALCTGWIAQPTATSLQPMTHWSCSEYLAPDPSVPSYSTDMYVQPVCPSYTVVGPSSMLTYTHAPLFTNFGTRTPSAPAFPQTDLQDTSVAYIPWAQPLTTLAGPAVQCSPCVGSFPGSQLLPLPMSVTVPEPDPQRLEQARTTLASLPLERLLEEDDDKDTYVTSPSLFIQGV